jgi:hypothetical protein
MVYHHQIYLVFNYLIIEITLFVSVFNLLL